MCIRDSVIVQGLGSGEGVLIHEDAFANLRLRIDLDQCWIGVSSGTKGDEMYEEERLAACRISSPGLRNKGESVSDEAQLLLDEEGAPHEHYTYVALWFDQPSFSIMSRSASDPRSRIDVARWRHHITLAYLPTMTAAQRMDLEKKLNDVYNDWRDIEPNHGPIDLLTSRRFVVGARIHDLSEDDVGDEFDRWPDTDVYTRYRSDFLHKKLKTFAIWSTMAYSPSSRSPLRLPRRKSLTECLKFHLTSSKVL